MSALRDAAAKFADADAQVLGATIEGMDQVKKFADSLSLPFPLLADSDGTLARAYGVEMKIANPKAPNEILTLSNRVTFVIDKEGKIVKTVSGKDALDPAGALAGCPLPKKK